MRVGERERVRKNGKRSGHSAVLANGSIVVSSF
jgi:hypothetical protein